ncbi:MAG: HAMP domain-containing protein [Cyclobacteriaceae bacterium]|nr:HAMP domain-containing protein [Cyclobacteriaceae bacterium]
MKIRLKLTLQFLLIISAINLLAFLSIYLLSAEYRKDEFYERLNSKSINTAKLLIDVHEIDGDLMRIIDMNTISLPEEKIMIYNYNNEEIYSSTDEDKIYPLALINKIRLEKDIRFREGRNECLGLLYSGEFDRFVVISTAFDQYGISKLNNLKWILIFVFIGCSVITLIGGWLFAGQAVKPIKRVIGEVEQITDKNLDKRINEGNRKDEIAMLSRTFNHMLNRLEQAFFAQESFVSHASHELRTPLTSIRGQVEVALMSSRNVDEYLFILQSVLEDVKRLTQLSDGLLALAQTKTDNIRETFSLIRIDEILFQARELILKKWPSYEINIEFASVPEDDLILYVHGDKQLFKSAMMNLIENACKYSGDHKSLVEIDFGGDNLIVRIIDKGPGIPGDEIEQIFLPFYRGKNSRNINGFGLGLSLARKILDIHEARLLVQSIPGKGTTVTVSIPNHRIFN